MSNTSELAMASFVPSVPTIRASDYSTVLNDPFLYFLTRRLGMTPSLSYSECLSHGSWVHAAAECDPFANPSSSEPALLAGVRSRLASRLGELRASCTRWNVTGESLAAILRTEEEDAYEGLAMYSAARDYVFNDGTSIRSKLASFVPVCREQVLTLHDPSYPDCPLVIQPDLLAIHRIRDLNYLWIIDYKTTDKPAALRLSICPIEHQTLHYIYVVSQLLASGQLHALFPNLPKNTTLAGMAHIAIGKPGIRLCSKDRPFTLDTTPFKSGPRKGTPRNERIYHGEPSFENYLTRVLSWYTATDEYCHLAPEWAASPPVNISWIRCPALLGRHLASYHARTRLIYDYATRDPDPLLFPMNPNNLIPHRNESVWFPFAFKPIPEWPALMRRNRIEIKPRPGDRP